MTLNYKPSNKQTAWPKLPQLMAKPILLIKCFCKGIIIIVIANLNSTNRMELMKIGPFHLGFFVTQFP